MTNSFSCGLPDHGRALPPLSPIVGRAGRLSRVVLLAAPLVACHAASAGEIIASRIKVRAVADNVSVESVQGKTSKTSISIFTKKKSTPDQLGVLDIGVVDIGEQAHIVGSNLEVNVQASNIYVKGATARIGSMYFR